MHVKQLFYLISFDRFHSHDIEWKEQLIVIDKENILLIKDCATTTDCGIKQLQTVLANSGRISVTLIKMQFQ